MILADTIIQIEAWFILVGGVHTQPPTESQLVIHSIELEMHSSIQVIMINDL